MTDWKKVIILEGFGFLFVIIAVALAAFNGLLFSNPNSYEQQASQFANNTVLGIGIFGVVLIIGGFIYAYISRNS